MVIEKLLNVIIKVKAHLKPGLKVSGFKLQIKAVGFPPFTKDFYFNFEQAEKLVDDCIAFNIEKKFRPELKKFTEQISVLKNLQGLFGLYKSFSAIIYTVNYDSSAVPIQNASLTISKNELIQLIDEIIMYNAR